jgi:hypothetical protein
LLKSISPVIPVQFCIERFYNAYILEKSSCVLLEPIMFWFCVVIFVQPSRFILVVFNRYFNRYEPSAVTRFYNVFAYGLKSSGTAIANKSTLYKLFFPITLPYCVCQAVLIAEYIVYVLNTTGVTSSHTTIVAPV